MKRILIAAIFMLAPALGAQTLSPVITECPKKCGGTFTVTNNGLAPVAATVELSSFAFDSATGKTVFRPLDSTTHVELSETSARIGPKQSHSFDYNVHCDVLPCSVIFSTAMITGHTDAGMAIRVILMHTVYVCEREKGCRNTVRKAAGLDQ